MTNCPAKRGLNGVYVAAGAGYVGGNYFSTGCAGTAGYNTVRAAICEIVCTVKIGVACALVRHATGDRETARSNR